MVPLESARGQPSIRKLFSMLVSGILTGVLLGTSFTVKAPGYSPSLPDDLEVITLANVENLVELRQVSNVGYIFVGLALDAKNQVLVTSTSHSYHGSEPPNLLFWDLKTLDLRRRLTMPGSYEISDLEFTSNHVLITASSDYFHRENEISFWNLQSYTSMITLAGHSERTRALALSPDQKVLASGSDDSTVRLWNPETGERLGTLNHSSGVFSVAFSPDGQQLAAGGEDGTIQLWETSNWERARVLTQQGAIWNLVFSSDGQILAAATGDTTNLWYLDHDNGVSQLNEVSIGFSNAFNLDNTIIASALSGGGVRLWDVETQTVLLERHADIFGLGDVLFSPDGRLLITGGLSSIRIWGVPSARSGENPR